MKNLVVVICLSTAACMSPLSETIVDQDTGFNGGFEVVKNDLPVNWMIYNKGEGDFQIMIDEFQKSEGKSSLHFKVTSCSDKGGHLSPGVAKEWAAEEGVTYLISAQVLNTKGNYKLRVAGVDSKHAAPPVFLSDAGSNAGWTRLEGTYTIPEGMNKLKIEFNMLSPGELWLDAITITKKSGS